MQDIRRNSHIKMLWSDRIFMAFIYTLLTLSLVLVLYPLIFIVSCSFSDPTNVLSGKVVFLPVDFSLYSYEQVFKYQMVMTGYRNSLIYTVLGTTISLSLTIMAAYPLAHRGFYGRRLFTAYFLFTMIFSGGLIPTYLQVKSVGMLGSMWAVIVPNAVAIWLVIIARTFFEQSIPTELYEAADLDGASDFGFLIRIVLPLSGPIIAVVALNYAVWLWNGYFDALIYLADRSQYPLQLVLRDILILNNNIDLQSVADIESAARKQGLAVVLKYSLIVVGSVPLLIVYPFVQKYFVKGMLVGAVKG